MQTQITKLQSSHVLLPPRNRSDGRLRARRAAAGRQVHQAQHERESVSAFAGGRAGRSRRCSSAACRNIPIRWPTRFAAGPAEVLGVEPDWILCGNGSDDILTIVTRALVGQGELLRLPYPSYILYRTLAEMQGARERRGSLQRRLVAADEFAAAARRSAAGVSAESQQPVGHGGSAASECWNWPSGCPARCWSTRPTPISPRRTACRWWRKSEKIMVSRTLSKSYALAGLRFGYHRGPAADDRAVDQGEGLVQLRRPVDRRRPRRPSTTRRGWPRIGRRSSPPAARLVDGHAEARVCDGRFAGQFRLEHRIRQPAGQTALRATETPTGSWSDT